MDVELPDGTVIEGVPEGTTKAQLYEKLKSNGYDVSGLEPPAPAAAAPERPSPEAQAFRGDQPYDFDNTGPNAAEKFAYSALHGLQRAIAGVEGAGRAAIHATPAGRLFAKATGIDPNISPQLQERLKQGEAYTNEAGGWGTAGRVAADVALSAVPVTRAAKALEPVLQKALIPAAARYAAPASASAAYAAVTSPEDRLTNALAAGAGSVVGQAAGAGLSRVVQPIRPTGAAKELIDRGVTLTPGQASGGILNTLEQYAASNPVSAPFIRNARQRGLEEANLAAVNAVRSNLSAAVKAGRPVSEAVLETRDLISQAYDDVLPHLNIEPSLLTDTVKSTLHSIKDDYPLLDNAHWLKLAKFLESRTAQLTRGQQTVTGEALKQLDSEIGYYARALARSPNPQDKVAARAWFDALHFWRDEVMTVSAPASLKQSLEGANTAYRELLTLEKALGVDKTMSPRRLLQAVDRQNVPSSSQLRQVAEATGEVFKKDLPDTGTAERLLANALPSLLLMGGAGAHQFGLPTVGAGMVAAGALGTRTGAKYLTGGFSKQRALAELLRAQGVPVTGAAVARQVFPLTSQE